MSPQADNHMAERHSLIALIERTIANYQIPLTRKSSREQSAFLTDLLTLKEKVCAFLNNTAVDYRFELTELTAYVKLEQLKYLHERGLREKDIAADPHNERHNYFRCLQDLNNLLIDAIDKYYESKFIDLERQFNKLATLRPEQDRNELSVLRHEVVELYSGCQAAYKHSGKDIQSFIERVNTLREGIITKLTALDHSVTHLHEALHTSGLFTHTASKSGEEPESPEPDTDPKNTPKQGA